MRGICDGETALVVSGELWTATSYCVGHPAVLKDIAFFSVSSSFGQIFIFTIMHEFGSLVVALVTTSRFV